MTIKQSYTYTSAQDTPGSLEETSRRLANTTNTSSASGNLLVDSNDTGVQTIEGSATGYTVRIQNSTSSATWLTSQEVIVVNNSTQSITVRDEDNNFSNTLVAGDAAICRCIDNTVGASTFSYTQRTVDQQEAYDNGGTITLTDTVAYEIENPGSTTTMFQVLSDTGETDNDQVNIDADAVDISGKISLDSVVRYLPTSINLSIDDTTTTLDKDYAEKVILTGGADNNEIALGNATTYYVGKTFEIHNASSEVAIIRNGNSDTYEFLMPKSTAFIKCTGVSDSNGEWNYLDNWENLNWKDACKFHDDYVYSDGQINRNIDRKSYLGGISGLSGAYAGTAGGVSFVGTGASNAAGESLQSNSTGYLQIGNGAVFTEANIRTNATGVNPNEFIGYVALTDTVAQNSGSGIANGVRIAIDTLSDTTNFVAASFVSSAEYNDASPTNVAFDSVNYFKVVIIVNSDATRADFYVNTTHIATITTLPASGTNLFFGWGIEGTGTGVQSRNFYRDYHRVVKNLTTKR